MTDRYQRYSEYLQSEHWGVLRSAKFMQVGKACQICRYDDRIHCHHIRYKELYDCTVADLVVLCEACHNDFHKACRKLNIDPLEKELLEINNTLLRFRLQKCYKGKPPKPRPTAATHTQRGHKLRKKIQNRVKQMVGAFYSSAKTQDDLQRLIDDLTRYKTSGVFAALNPVKVVVLPKPEPLPVAYDAANAPF